MSLNKKLGKEQQQLVKELRYLRIFNECSLGFYGVPLDNYESEVRRLENEIFAIKTIRHALNHERQDSNR